MVLIPVSTNSLTQPLLPSSCPKLPAHPGAQLHLPLHLGLLLRSASPWLGPQHTTPCLTLSAFAFGARGREKLKMPLGFWLGHWGDDRAIP